MELSPRERNLIICVLISIALSAYFMLLSWRYAGALQNVVEMYNACKDTLPLW